MRSPPGQIFADIKSTPPGAQVYYWQTQRAKNKMKGQRRRQHDRWRGSGTVIGHEMRDGVQFNALWISHGRHLRLVAPQHVRSASPEEQVSEHDSMRRLRSVMDFSRSQMEFENLIEQDDPPIDIDEDNEDQQSARRTRSRKASSREDSDPEEKNPHL